MLMANHTFRVIYQLVWRASRAITCINCHQFNYQVSAIDSYVRILGFDLNSLTKQPLRSYILESKRANTSSATQRSMWMHVCVLAYVNNQLNYRQTRLDRRRPNLRLQCPNRYSGIQLYRGPTVC